MGVLRLTGTPTNNSVTGSGSKAYSGMGGMAPINISSTPSTPPTGGDSTGIGGTGSDSPYTSTSSQIDSYLKDLNAREKVILLEGMQKGLYETAGGIQVHLESLDGIRKGLVREGSGGMGGLGSGGMGGLDAWATLEAWVMDSSLICTNSLNLVSMHSQLSYSSLPHTPSTPTPSIPTSKPSIPRTISSTPSTSPIPPIPGGNLSSTTTHTLMSLTHTPHTPHTGIDMGTFFVSSTASDVIERCFVKGDVFGLAIEAVGDGMLW